MKLRDDEISDQSQIHHSKLLQAANQRIIKHIYSPLKQKQKNYIKTEQKENYNFSSKIHC